ncbi:MAG: hypothetical protein ABIU54_09160 [Candidatus Eisenbacteria bacterium]
MRSIGTLPGNSVLRSMIRQAARRRLYAELTPSQGGPSGEADPREARWSLAFFERLRQVLLPRTAAVASLEVGELRYFESSASKWWVLTSPHDLVVAYDYQDSPEQLRDRARRWIACLQTRTAPGLASQHWGHPVYGARLDPRSGKLDVVWATPGHWLDLVLGDGLLEREPTVSVSAAGTGMPD